MDLAAGTHVAQYVVEGLLGRGGMASVWLVRHEALGSRVGNRWSSLRLRIAGI